MIVFDQDIHLDMPPFVRTAFEILLRSIDIPGSVSRPHQCEAVALLREHFNL